MIAEDFNYVKNIGALTLEQKRKFYTLFGHNLTVSVRAIWSDENYSDKEKIVGMKEINEIMHRLIFRIQELNQISKVEEDPWSEEDFWNLIKHHCSENFDVLAVNVGWAIKTSYNSSAKD